MQIEIKKGLFFVLIFQLFFMFVFAQQTFEIEKKPIRNVWIKEYENFPLIYELQIKSKFGANYKFFSLLDVLISPSQIYINQSPQTINLSFYIRKDLPPNKYTYTYYIKNVDTGEIIKDSFTFEVVNAKDIFSFSIQEKINKDDKSFKLKIKNKFNLNFDNITLRIYNNFIDSSFDLSIRPFEEKEIDVNIKENVKEEWCGAKDVKIDIILYGKGYTFEKQIWLEEYREIKTEEKTESIFLGKKIYVKKTNLGNNVTEAIISIKLNSFEKIFAKGNTKAEIKKEKDFYVYVFKKNLKPGESFEVEMSINYQWLLIIPLIIIIIIILLILRKEEVVVKKDVKRVKTKSGEFALRVFLSITNKTRESLKEVAILDYLPLSLKFYEFGLTLPDKVEGNKLYWVLGEIPAGETRSISYLCYSKIRYEGRMVMPRAKIKYLLRGKKHIKESNSCAIDVKAEEGIEI